MLFFLSIYIPIFTKGSEYNLKDLKIYFIRERMKMIPQIYIY